MHASILVAFAVKGQWWNEDNSYIKTRLKLVEMAQTCVKKGFACLGFLKTLSCIFLLVLHIKKNVGADSILKLNLIGVT